MKLNLIHDFDNNCINMAARTGPIAPPIILIVVNAE